MSPRESTILESPQGNRGTAERESVFVYSAPPVAEIVEQYVSDVPFLWNRRERVVRSSSASVRSLANSDERLDAHVDGLRVSADAAWELCETALATARPGDVFTAAVIAFESGDPRKIDRALEFASIDHEWSKEIVASLGWQSRIVVENSLASLVRSADPTRRLIAIAAHAIWRMDPGPVLKNAIGENDPRVRSRALQAAGEIGRVDLLPICRRALSDADATCRLNAARSVVRLGDRSAEAAGVLSELATSNSACSIEAVETMVRAFRGRVSDELLASLSKNDCNVRRCAAGFGARGERRDVESLIDLSRDPTVARIAAAHLGRITGMDLSVLGLRGEPPVGFRAEPSDDPDADDVVDDADADLPWPEPTLIEQWWKEQRAQYASDARYLFGRPIESASLRDALESSPQQVRVAAAFELGLLHPTQPTFEVRAPWRRQRERLGMRSTTRQRCGS